uniref:Uncharacterized protein n=1 Tax=Photinus pyralis TaxID=7054 RepID=A0A1Y1NB64_PHOPY
MAQLLQERNLANRRRGYAVVFAFESARRKCIGEELTLLVNLPNFLHGNELAGLLIASLVNDTVGAFPDLFHSDKVLHFGFQLWHSIKKLMRRSRAHFTEKISETVCLTVAPCSLKMNSTNQKRALAGTLSTAVSLT